MNTLLLYYNVHTCMSTYTPVLMRGFVHTYMHVHVYECTHVD